MKSGWKRVFPQTSGLPLRGTRLDLIIMYRRGLISGCWLAATLNSCGLLGAAGLSPQETWKFASKKIDELRGSAYFGKSKPCPPMPCAEIRKIWAMNVVHHGHSSSPRWWWEWQRLCLHMDRTCSFSFKTQWVHGDPEKDRRWPIWWDLP